MIIDEAQSGTNHGNKQSKPFGFSMNTNLGIRTKADSSCETILSITIDQLRVFIIANTTLLTVSAYQQGVLIDGAHQQFVDSR